MRVSVCVCKSVSACEREATERVREGKRLLPNLCMGDKVLSCGTQKIPRLKILTISLRLLFPNIKEWESGGILDNSTKT